MNRLILLIFVVNIGFCLLAEGWKKGRRHRKREVTKFMHVSDVHFDLFYNQSVSEDTSCRILGDPGAVSRVERKGATKVFKYGRKSPWVPTLNEPFPKIQTDATS